MRTSASLRVFALVLALAVDAGATTLTGVDLLTHPGVTFPNGPPGVSGSSLVFSGPAELNVMVAIDLDLPASGTVSVTTTRLGDDSDLWYGLWDGVRFAAFTFFDGFRSNNQTACAESDGVLIMPSGCPPLTTVPDTQSVGEQATAVYSFDLLSGVLAFEVGGLAFPGALPVSFDTGGDVSFLIGSGKTLFIGEEHRLDEVSLEIVPVPEPGTMGLTVVGLLGFGLMRQRHPLGREWRRNHRLRIPTRPR